VTEEWRPGLVVWSSVLQPIAADGVRVLERPPAGHWAARDHHARQAFLCVWSE